MNRETMKLIETISNGISRKRDTPEALSIKGFWVSEHWRNGQLIGTYVAPNDITVTAKNSLFNVYFNAATQTPAGNWCGGLINDASWTGYNATTDTIASHPGWTEWTAYSQTTRVAWGQGTASAAAIANASPMQFDINGTGSVHGLFIATDNTKGGTTGLLWSAASYTSIVAVVPGDQIRSIYSLSC